jgi:DNA recombination protein RmuC
MDITTLVIVVLALLALVAPLSVYLLTRNAGGGGETAAQMAVLQDNLNRLASQQAQTNQSMSEALQRQERELTRMLGERLDTVSKRLGDSLTESSEKSNKTLGELRERLVKIDEAQKNIQELSTQVVGLQDILSNKQARGAFGQVQMEDLVRSILPPNAYAFQATLSNDSRPDCLLLLPNPPGSIVIDAKYPLESYEKLQKAENDAEKTAAMRQFSNDIRKHVRDIAEKYIIHGETAESALMFLPSEAVYAEMHANFRDVVEESYKNRVWIVSPTTLMATLNTVRAVLRDVQIRERADEIQKLVGYIKRDTERLDERAGKLETHLERAVKSAGELRTSASQIRSRGERVAAVDLEDDDGAPLLPEDQ